MKRCATALKEILAAFGLRGLVIFVIFAVVLSLASLYLLSRYYTMTRKNLEYADNDRFLDRQGNVLAFFPDNKGERHLWGPLEAFPAHVIDAFLAAEDERFFQHPGFDLPAIIRAAKDNYRAGRTVSGASTITQQLVKDIYPRPRTYRGKIEEILRSILLERRSSKQQILEHYLNRVPQGNNIRGVPLAAQIYFGKPVSRLTVVEAAMLAALPKAPGYLNPYKGHDGALRTRRDWVLSRMAECNMVTEETYRDALTRGLSVIPLDIPYRTPHLIWRIKQGFPDCHGLVRTTIDSSIQGRVEAVLASHRDRLRNRGVSQASCMVIHNETMEVLAYAGSFSWNRQDYGYNDGVQALRSPGSTLKPFLYALALEQGFTAASILEDMDRRYPAPEGDYIPANYDKRVYGPITVRKALANSLNLSAINVLNNLGYGPFYHRLKQLGLINFPHRGPDYYGLGLVVGNPEVTLEQLVTAYAMLANGGIYRPCRYIIDATGHDNNELRISDRATSAIITDILRDNGARMLTFGTESALSFPFPVAVKTGTSTQYRDCWTIGYSTDFTIGVWAGNFDGSPTWSQSGASAAAPIFHDVMMFLHRGGTAGRFEVPNECVLTEICPESGKLPSSYCPHRTMELFVKGTAPGEYCSLHRQQKSVSELPFTYAKWLFNRGNRSVPERYHLVGDSDGLLTIFDDPWKIIDSPVSSEGNDDTVADGQAIRRNTGNVPPNKPLTASRSRHHFDHQQLSGQTTGSVSIIYPMNGDCFLIDRSMPDQAIELQARVTSEERSITWFINGMEYATTGPPFSIYWTLRRGVHELMAIDSRGLGDQISFSVQ